MDAETQNRTVDTAIFSRVLYQLSYLGLRTIFYMDMAGVSSEISELAVRSNFLCDFGGDYAIRIG